MTTQSIRNLGGLGRAVARFGRLLSRIAAEEARLRRSVEWHQSKIDQRKLVSKEKTSRWESQRDALAHLIFGYVDPRRGELITPGTKLCEVGTGSIRYDEGRDGATFFPQGEDAAVAAIERLLSPELAGHILKKEVRKNVLKDVIRENPEIAGILGGFIEIPIVDRFVIEPQNSERGFRQALSWFSHPEAV